jgi:hypothetical protein
VVSPLRLRQAEARQLRARNFTSLLERERVLFIGTQFSILYTFMYSPALGLASSKMVKCARVRIGRITARTRRRP